MKVKVQPSEETPEKKSASSKFTKFLRLLSNAYILPIQFENNFKEVKFSLISFRTIISFMVQSTPFFLVMIWCFIVQWEFSSQFFKKSLHVYYLFDFVLIFILNVNPIHPFSQFPVTLLICHIWASLPELSQE